MECVADTLQGHLAGGTGIVDMLTGAPLEEIAAEMPEADVDVKVPRKAAALLTWELCGCLTGVVWTMKFSKNGKYLASAGQDAAVRVWEVCLNRGEARAESESEQSASEAGERTTEQLLPA